MYVLTANYSQPDAADVFVRSIKDTGFGVVKNHPIQPELIQAVYQEWESFFNSQDKFNYLYDKETQDGYFPFLTENAKGSEYKDLKEFYHLYEWGRYPASLSKKTLELFQALNELAMTLLQWIEVGTPEEVRVKFSQPLKEMIRQSPKTLLRILYYPPLTGSEEPGAVRAAAHEDIDLLTLLPAATATGLQVKDTQGNWHPVECDPGTIVVNAGDMLQMCSGGYYTSTTHRVMNPVGAEALKPRLSMPLFLHPNMDVQLSKEHTAGTYLWERLREIGVA